MNVRKRRKNRKEFREKSLNEPRKQSRENHEGNFERISEIIRERIQGENLGEISEGNPGGIN